MSPLTDAERDRVERFIREHACELRRLSRRLNRGRLDAADAYQAACIGALRALRAHDPERGPLTPLLQRCVCNEMSRAAREHRDHAELNEDAISASAAPDPTARTDTARLLGALPRRARRLVELVSAGRTMKEAAHLVGIGRTTAHAWYAQAIAALREAAA